MKVFNKPALKLGVTGGIGSGKTSVCKVFTVLGIPVFYADRVANDIMDGDYFIKEKINSIAGTDLYRNGALDRMALASIIFNNRLLLEKVNSLIHPVVFEHFTSWVGEQTSPYVIMEAAILFESGASKLVDKVVSIIAPVEERLDRVTHRSKLTMEQVKERMNNQMSDESRIKLSDYIIHNSENDMIIPSILKIHEDILLNIKNAY